MPAPDQILQGEDYTFTATFNKTLSGATYTLEAKQYPDDAATISREVTLTDNVLEVTITSAETESLAVGLWHFTVQAVDSDNEEHFTQRAEVKKGWL